LVLLSCLLAYVFGSIIDPGVFNIDYEPLEDVHGGMVIEVISNVTNCTSEIVLANVIPTGNITVSNTSIVYNYNVIDANGTILAHANRTTTVHRIPGCPPTLCLENAFVVSVVPTNSTASSYKLLKVNFRAFDAECPSSIETVFSRRTGFEWFMIPSFLLGYTEQIDSGVEASPMRISLLAFGQTTFEVRWQTVIPGESELLNVCDPRFFLAQKTVAARGDIDEGNFFVDVDDDDDESIESLEIEIPGVLPSIFEAEENENEQLSQDGKVSEQTSEKSVYSEKHVQNMSIEENEQEK
jgi:hypothetical protein